MSFTFENQGTNTYLVYKVASDDSLDPMSLGMLTNNKIPGLAPALFMQMDETKYIKYNVSSKVSARQFFEGQVNRKRLLGVFRGITDAMLSAEDYMIDINTIMLDLDYIFADVSTCNTELVCLPLMNQHSGTDLVNFFKSIMFSTQFDQTENCDHVAAIINYLNRSQTLSLSDFKRLLDGFERPSTSAFGVLSNSNINVSGSFVNEKPMNTDINASLDHDLDIGSQPATKWEPYVTVFPKNSAVSANTPSESDYSNSQKNDSSQNSFPKSELPIKETLENTSAEEEQISLFYLLVHYSKENKELYDRQKAAKKEKSNKKNNKKEDKNKASNNGDSNKYLGKDFAIPGQNVAAINAQEILTPKRMGDSSALWSGVSKDSTPALVGLANESPVEAHYGETRPLNSSSADPTTEVGIESSASTVTPYLIRQKDGSRIMINKSVFRIGRETNYVDYCILDNQAVGRSHAYIKSQDGKFYVVDTNSLNHTYVNGTMIPSATDTELTHGCELRFANENFEFRLY